MACASNSSAFQQGVTLAASMGTRWARATAAIAQMGRLPNKPSGELEQ